ncbi:MAG: histidine phosphatase family protein [Acidobacteriales bacterium 59-55]|nr:histidine phosphatase family protein [Terriglobales bacterium]OJV41942.1 MAG: histidine phosphatase family protein [Acidobacteriales bacterium 59-55]
MGAGTELWLIRHGETEWSLSRKHTGRTDIGLTEHGRRRAEELRNYLVGEKFAAVLTSPLKRARETCEIAGFGDVAEVDNGLREWDYGIQEGRTTEEIRAETPGWSVWTHEISGGETLEQVGARADGVIDRALAVAGDGERVALFAHAHILRILAARWVELGAREGRLFVLGTGSVSVLGWEREARVIQAWNRGFEE